MCVCVCVYESVRDKTAKQGFDGWQAQCKAKVNQASEKKTGIHACAYWISSTWMYIIMCVCVCVIKKSRWSPEGSLSFAESARLTVPPYCCFFFFFFRMHTNKNAHAHDSAEHASTAVSFLLVVSLGSFPLSLSLFFFCVLNFFCVPFVIQKNFCYIFVSRMSFFSFFFLSSHSHFLFRCAQRRA